MRQFNTRRRLRRRHPRRGRRDRLGRAGPGEQHRRAADCDTRLEQLEARFRVIEERRGYEAATAWWQVRWQTYYKRCLQP